MRKLVFIFLEGYFSSFSLFFLFISYLFVCVCFHTEGAEDAALHTLRLENSLQELVFPSTMCESWELNSGHQGQPQAPLPPELSHWLLFLFCFRFLLFLLFVCLGRNLYS